MKMMTQIVVKTRKLDLHFKCRIKNEACVSSEPFFFFVILKHRFKFSDKCFECKVTWSVQGKLWNSTFSPIVTI